MLIVEQTCIYKMPQLDDRFASSITETNLDFGPLKSEICPFEDCFDPNAPAVIKVRNNAGDFVSFDNSLYTLVVDNL